MDDSLLSGISSYLMLGGTGMSTYLTNPYLSGMYSSSIMSQAGISNVFQSGVRFGQALEKAKENNPESAEQLQKILDEAFGSKSSQNSAKSGSSGKVRSGVVYEPSWGSKERSQGSLEDYLAGRRASRAQQRQASRQH